MTAAAAIAVPETKLPKYATAIDKQAEGKLVQYFDEGWRIGTLVTFRPESGNASIMPIGKKTGAVIVALEDIRPANQAEGAVNSGQPAPVAQQLKESLQPATPKGRKVGAVKVPGLGSIPLIEAPAPAPQQAASKAEQPPAAPKPRKPASKPAKAKTTPKPKAEKPAKPEKPAAPETPTHPQHEVELLPYSGPDSRDCYFAKVHGKRVAVRFQERNRAQAAARFNSITIREAATKDAAHVAKAEGLELWLGVQVRVDGKWNQGYLMPFSLAKAHFTSDCDFALSGAARRVYHEDKTTLEGVRFTIAKAAK